MNQPQLHIVKTNRKEKFWFHNIRAVNYFCYRYWWLVLFAFLLYLLLWYWFCFRVPITTSCSTNQVFSQTVDKISRNVDSCCNCKTMPVMGLKWDLINNNPCSKNSWVVSPDNTVLRYEIIDSKNCGGPCDMVQSGSAKANITVGDKDVLLNLNFDGIGELQESNYELINFYLDGKLVADAHAAGGGLGCKFGPVIKKYHIQSPYLLTKGSKHLFEVNFTTNDPLFHKGCYYQVYLNLSTL